MRVADFDFELPEEEIEALVQAAVGRGDLRTLAELVDAHDDLGSQSDGATMEFLVKDGNRATPYLRLARGVYGSDGEARYKKGGCTLPIDRDILNQLADAMLINSSRPSSPRVRR